MAWQTPKTNWTSSESLISSDLNRIEGNIDYIENSVRTPSGTATISASGKLNTMLSSFASQIKKITGKTNWYDAPSKNLVDLNAHIGAGGSFHHPIATASSSGFMSGSDKAKLDRLTQLYHARGKWSDTTSVIPGTGPGNGDFEVVIDPGFVAKGGWVHIKAPQRQEGVSVVLTTLTSDGLYFGYSDVAARVGMYAYVHSIASINFGAAIYVYWAIINSLGKISVKFRGPIGNTLNVPNLQWEAWG